MNGNWIYQLVLFVVAVFVFVVLLGHGFENFPQGTSEEFGRLMNFIAGGADLPPAK